MTKYNQLEEEYSVFVGSKYSVAVNSGTSALHLALVALGIGQGDEVIVPDFTMARYFFKPLSTMPMFKQEVGSNALYYSKHGAYYLINPEMKEDDVDIICKI